MKLNILLYLFILLFLFIKNSEVFETNDIKKQEIHFDLGEKGLTDEIVNNSGNLELYSSNKPLTGDFTFTIKILKMQKQGYLLLGFNRDTKSEKTDGYFAIGNPNGWGIGSNGFVAEYGKWSILPTSFLNENNEITFIRKDNILGFSINGIFTKYGYLMEDPLYFTSNLSKQGDSIKILN